MRYVGTVFRPPSEAGSLLIQATIGCPHNKCRFCGMYKKKRFKIRPLKDILQDIQDAREAYGPGIRTMFLPDGNTIIMKTRSLIEILTRAREVFPQLERITLYGSARYINLKTPEDMSALASAGLKRIHMGMESGDDVTLKRMNKGATAAETAAAGRKVKTAGIELSAYYLVGIGGRDRLVEHATAGAEVLNLMGPDFIRLRTYQPVMQAPLAADIEQGRFQLPTPHEALHELELLVSRLKGPTMLLSDHISNYLNLTGHLPEDRTHLLAAIRDAKKRDESHFSGTFVHL